MAELPELRAVVRQEAAPDPATLVVRGGLDSIAKLQAHAGRTARAFALDGVPALGLSVFAALDDIGSGSLDGILTGKLSTYQVIHLVTAGEIMDVGFTLLPTFARPHFTLLLTKPSEVDQLLDLLGPPRKNPHYGEMHRRRRR